MCVTMGSACPELEGEGSACPAWEGEGSAYPGWEECPGWEGEGSVCPCHVLGGYCVCTFFHIPP